MKILFLSNIPTPYQLDFIEEINRLESAEIAVFFLWGTEKNRDWKLKNNNVKILKFSKKFSDYYKFYKFFKSFKPDFILIGGYKIPLSNFAIFLAKVNDCKIIFWLEKPMPYQKIKKTIRNFHLKLKLLFADCVLAIGKNAQNDYQKFSNFVYNLPYSMNFEDYYKIDRKNINNCVKFLFSGQLIDRKNILTLVKTFKKIKNWDISLTIIGAGELADEIQRTIKKDNRVEFLGFVQPENLSDVFRQSNVFVLPSKYDGWAVVITEAMAAGMPIVSTKETGAAIEYIKHKENGYLCGIDEESIKQGLMFYINNPKLIYEHGYKNREIIKNSAVDARNAALYLYKTLLNLK